MISDAGILECRSGFNLHISNYRCVNAPECLDNAAANDDGECICLFNYQKHLNGSCIQMNDNEMSLN